MVFSNTVFLFLFLPVVFILYYAVPVTRLRNILLTIASVVFYAYGEPFAVFLMLASTALNYVFGMLMSGKNKYRKCFLVLSVIANITVLGIYKYADFAVGIINDILPVSIPKPGIALPIGISFFTFQAMSYVIDVYKTPETVQKNPFRLLFYISFFPQLIAGPIVKYHDFEHQITERKLSAKLTAQGVRRFICGLAKKLLIANQMASAADMIFNSDESVLSMPTAWIGAIAYTLQIYFDFSGYSDMAIGLGKMFGFEFRENFDYPYSSSSVTEFWRKWHISLSTWFREYLYIPLGGNRKGKYRTALNKMIVFFFTGLWHGASFTFVIWGLLNGLMLLFESFTGLFKDKKIKGLGNVYTLIFTVTAFVVFRCETLGRSVSFYKAMFAGFDISEASLAIFAQVLSPVFITALAFAVLFSIPVKGAIEKKISGKAYAPALNAAAYIGSLALLLLCILNLSSAAYNPFIYFRF